MRRGTVMVRKIRIQLTIPFTRSIDFLVLLWKRYMFNPTERKIRRVKEPISPDLIACPEDNFRLTNLVKTYLS